MEGVFVTTSHARSHYCHRVIFSENMYVTTEYTSEATRVQRVPESGLCKQYDDLLIVGDDETKCLIGGAGMAQW